MFIRLMKNRNPDFKKNKNLKFKKLYIKMGYHDCKCSRKSDKHCKKHRNSKCMKKYCKPATIKTKCTLGDLITRSEAGGSFPADPNMAVGPEQLITTVNLTVAINDKHTGQRLSLTPSRDFWNIVPPTADSFLTDPFVMFDEFTNRFIALMFEGVNFNADSELSVESPGIISGTYPANKGSNAGSQAPFDLSGFDIVPADPLNADTPLVNDLTGKIALIAGEDFSVPSSIKCLNATNAGAIACIIFNDENVLNLIFGSNIVPSISVGLDIGEAMLANLPVVGGMKSLTPSEIGINVFSRMHLAISKDATPKTKDDFYTYVVGDKNGPYKQLLTDFPKVGVDEDAIYIHANSGNLITNFPGVDVYSQIVAVEKAPLIAGTGPVNILLNDLVFIVTATSGFNNGIFNVSLPTLLHPPKNNTQQVSFAVAAKTFQVGEFPGDGDTLVVTSIKDILGTPKLENFELKVEPWTFPLSSSDPVIQPDGIFQGAPFFFPTFKLLTIPVMIQYRCVQFEDSLWCCHTVGNPDLNEVRWYEIDVSKIFDNNGPTVSLKQQGTIKPGGTTSAFYPSIDVDKDGNMAIGFNISGPDQPVAMAHTGRLKNDPPGTVRFPLEVNFEAQPDLPYVDDSIDPAEDFGSRWCDYTSLQLDPSDNKTFWYCSQYSNLNEGDYLNFNTQWSTATSNFCVNKKKCAKTVCKQKGCPKIPKVTESQDTASQDVKVLSKEEFVEELKKKAPKNKKWWKNPAV